ncbi:hypothetical protein J6590_059268 [Homalodisca vitripennis]|nr:hypothetical protein J6590_059268 [Homalodisca vitripennis]
MNAGPNIKGCTVLPDGVTPWSRDRIRHEPDVCRVYPLATMGALWFTRLCKLQRCAGAVAVSGLIRPATYGTPLPSLRLPWRHRDEIKEMTQPLILGPAMNVASHLLRPSTFYRYSSP